MAHATLAESRASTNSSAIATRVTPEYRRCFPRELLREMVSRILVGIRDLRVRYAAPSDMGPLA